MNKSVAIAVLAVVGIIIGAVAYFALLADRGSPAPPSNPTPAARVPEEFDSARFMNMFDVDQDNQVSRQEFMAVFETGEFALTAGGGKPLSAEEIFTLLDVNQDGTISASELRRFSDKAWRKFQDEAAQRGLHAREWQDRMLTLNGPRLRAFNHEVGAQGRDELPFGGLWVAPAYIADWCEIRESNGEVYQAYVSERGGRKFALRGITNVLKVEYDAAVEAQVATEQRKHLDVWAAPTAGTNIDGIEYDVWGALVQGGADPLTVEGMLRHEAGHVHVAQFQPKIQVVGKDAEVTPLPDAPQNVYAKQIKALAFDDEDGNLDLARHCVIWGMHTEARMLYLRVLIFQPANREALDYWGIDRQGDQYKPRKN